LSINFVGISLRKTKDILIAQLKKNTGYYLSTIQKLDFGWNRIELNGYDLVFG
jgi:hypothetical protein